MANYFRKFIDGFVQLPVWDERLSYRLGSPEDEATGGAYNLLDAVTGAMPDMASDILGHLIDSEFPETRKVAAGSVLVWCQVDHEASRHLVERLLEDEDRSIRRFVAGELDLFYAEGDIPVEFMAGLPFDNVAYDEDQRLRFSVE